MDFKKIMSEMLLNINKNEITISTELNNNSDIIFLKSIIKLLFIFY